MAKPIRITRRQLNRLVREAMDHSGSSDEDRLSKDAHGELSDPHVDYDKDHAEHALDTMDEMGGAMIYEDSGEEEGHHYRDNAEEDEQHLRDLEKDIRYDKDHVHEGRLTTSGFRRMIAQEIQRALKR
tara:strand:- start:1341 stop:1724 length:384 start_codon:yes stop_codon:yes gene_type:complete